MSLLPFFYDSYYRPPSLFDQHFAIGISPEDIITPTFDNFRNQFYVRPWKIDIKDAGSTVKNEKDKFEVMLDVKQFKPEEIRVKTTDTEIIIEGKHEEKQDDHGFVSRQFTRKYMLPKSCDSKTVMSSLTSDGVLIITAKKIKELESAERSVPIKVEDTKCLTCPINLKCPKEKDIKETCTKGKETAKDTAGSKNATNIKDTKESISKDMCSKESTMIKESITDMTTTEMLTKIDETLKNIKDDLKTDKSIRDDRCSLLNPDGTLKFSGATTMDASAIKSEFSSSSMEMSSKEASSFSSMSVSMDSTAKTEKSEFLSDKIMTELKQAAENF